MLTLRSRQNSRGGTALAKVPRRVSDNDAVADADAIDRVCFATQPHRLYEYWYTRGSSSGIDDLVFCCPFLRFQRSGADAIRLSSAYA